MSDGAFNWGNEGKGSSKSSKGSGLPKHIQRMNNPTEVAEVKKSVGTNDSGLPWGGEPPEKKKAYMGGVPKNKSTTEALGQRGANSSKLSSDSHPAHAGYSTTIKTKHAPMGGMKKK